jgi:hypothetical protein
VYEARIIRQAYYEYLVNIKQTASKKVLSYEDVFLIGDIGELSKVKFKIIQEIIQNERPVSWSIERMIKITSKIKNIELHSLSV